MGIWYLEPFNLNLIELPRVSHWSLYYFVFALRQARVRRFPSKNLFPMDSRLLGLYMPDLTSASEFFTRFCRAITRAADGMSQTIPPLSKTAHTIVNTDGSGICHTHK